MLGGTSRIMVARFSSMLNNSLQVHVVINVEVISGILGWGLRTVKKIRWNLSAPQSHVRNMNFSLVAWSLLKRRYGPGLWVILLGCCIPGVLGMKHLAQIWWTIKRGTWAWLRYRVHYKRGSIQVRGLFLWAIWLWVFFLGMKHQSQF